MFIVSHLAALLGLFSALWSPSSSFIFNCHLFSSIKYFTSAVPHLILIFISILFSFTCFLSHILLLYLVLSCLCGLHHTFSSLTFICFSASNILTALPGLCFIFMVCIILHLQYSSLSQHPLFYLCRVSLSLYVPHLHIVQLHLFIISHLAALPGFYFIFMVCISFFHLLQPLSLSQHPLVSNLISRSPSYFTFLALYYVSPVSGSRAAACFIMFPFVLHLPPILWKKTNCLTSFDLIFSCFHYDSLASPHLISLHLICSTSFAPVFIMIHLVSPHFITPHFHVFSFWSILLRIISPVLHLIALWLTFLIYPYFHLYSLLFFSSHLMHVFFISLPVHLIL